ncbi:MAG TPA: prephenate dehydratase [Blastocatellia bacterium]|nr:prephenate dehydratase [Blastocatellia bacterium]
MTDNGNQPLRAAYQGEPGAFSEMAARKLLGPDILTLPFRAFEEMFAAVATGAADVCVAPIENSLAGSIHKNYDLLVEHDLTIIGETNLRIVHNLIAPPGVALSEVRRVYSHPVALAQCGRFLRAHPQIEVRPAHDTAGSVRAVIENGRLDEAAIAGAAAAEVYGARILSEGIEDNAQNYTRFLLLARPEWAGSIKTLNGTNRRKTSIVFRVANRPGALFRALAVFALRDVDLAKIESRPIEGRPWEYSFYLDLIGDARDAGIERALAHLAEMAEAVRVLGSYPSAEAGSSDESVNQST